MSRRLEVEDWVPAVLPAASEEALRRLPARVHPAANGAADDFTDGLLRRFEVPVGREITVSNRSGTRKVLPDD